MARSKWKGGFNVPITFKAPIEKVIEIEQEEEVELTYDTEQEASLHKEYTRDKQTKKNGIMKKVSTLKRVGLYLFERQDSIVSYEEMRIDLSISNVTARAKVQRLNVYKLFSMTWIPSPGNPGCIQTTLKDIDSFDDWDIKKQRTIVTMTKVRGKANQLTNTKRDTTRKQVKVEVREKNG